MSKLDDLLKQYCPDGVEYKCIEKLCHISRGRVISKDYIRENPGDYPVYSSQTENSGVLGAISDYAYDGKYLTWTTDGANAGTIFYREGRFNITNVCGLLEVKDSLQLNIKFLFYALEITVKNYVNKGMGNPKLMSNVMARIPIPVPPLKIQCEIVRILDSFTALTAELTAELTARRAQYEYYRDRLLSFEDETAIVKRIKDMLDQTCGGAEKVKNLPIGQLCNVSRGKVISKEYIQEHPGEYPVFSSQTENNGCLGEIDSFDYEGQFVTWTTDGANAGTVFYRDGKFNITNVCGLLRPKDTSQLETKYLFYCLQIKAKNYVSKGMGNPKLMSNVMERITIPVPPNKVQREIVNILDKFNTLTTDITTGLPAEISLRQKQYEHYRDRLLNFNGGGIT